LLWKLKYESLSNCQQSYYRNIGYFGGIYTCEFFFKLTVVHYLFSYENSTARYTKTKAKSELMYHQKRTMVNIFRNVLHEKQDEMHSLVGRTPCSYGQNRKEQVVLIRCRIGHCRLTHGYLFQCVLGFPVNDCVPMNTYMTRDPCENYMFTNSNKAFINFNNF
jgi:hypothetical protein